MTHPADVVSRSLDLAANGRSATQIARILGLPRATVRDWIAGRVPGGARSGGDACAQCGAAHDPHPRGVFKLRICLDACYPGVMEECEDAMRTVMPRSRVNRVGYGTWFELYSYSKSWPCLFPQHGAGKKHERAIRLTPWQWALVSERPDRLLRGLLHSDGCRFQNTGRGGWAHPRYAFSNKSLGIRAIFCATCDLLGLRWTPSGSKTIYVSRKDDVAVLDLFVGPKR